MTLKRIALSIAALGLFSGPALAEGQVRTYYIAADMVDWDYAPKNRNILFDRPFGQEEAHAVNSGDYRVGKIFKKAIYREYTDDSFTKLKPRPEAWKHLGILGPLIRAEVGDRIKIIFRNNADFPATIHPHGVFYQKDSEGALYNDGTTGKDKADDSVPTGGTHIYIWDVPERAGPPENGLSSAFWMYHSHSNEERDVNAGLIGPMIVTAKGKARANLMPTDVDREFVVAFMTIEEHESWYFRENLDHYAAKPGEINVGIGLFGATFAMGPDNAIYQPFMENMNGYLYGNGEVMTAKKGERVRWYVMAGTGFEVHAPHWHGNVVTEGMMRTDILELTTMGMHVTDMIPDVVGKWLFHCHVANHFKNGMGAFYEVTAE
ncbi:MAG: multicopper oxidase domain-containing protein [Sphingomonadales bacterium]|jgi:hephaestin